MDTNSPWCGTKEAAAIARLHPRTLLQLRRKHPTVLDDRVCYYELGRRGFQWHRERFVAALDQLRHGTGRAA